MSIRTTLGMVLGLVAGTIGAQQANMVSGATPVENLKGDPIQGGALSEYHDAAAGSRPSPSRGPQPQDHGNYQGWSPPVTGAPFDTRMMPPPAPMQELAEQSRNGVSWLCGGVGQREVAYMKKEARHYDVMLTFTARNGAYLADVEVEILDKEGNSLLQTQCGGPIMLVGFSTEGYYRIRAEVENHPITRSVRVPASQGQYRHIVMSWPLAAANADAVMMDMRD